MTTINSVNDAWERISEPVLNNVKIYFLRQHVNTILHHYHDRIRSLLYGYTRQLPAYVAEGEADDLHTVAKLEFLETLKAWNPKINSDIWPLAKARIIGAMKDHIRYITRTDPTRFYEWMTDAAHLYVSANERADFEETIETGIQLSEAMKCLTFRERRIVLAHTTEDLTFKQIGEKLNISESQISRIYKKAIERVKKQLEKSKKT